MNKQADGEFISRQALLDAFGFSEKTRKWGGDHSGYNTMMLYEIQDIIESQPSVKPQEPKYCDRNICLRNEYNGIGCDECEVTKSQEPSGDLISRQDAIKAIDEKAKRIKNEDTLNGLAGAVGILFDLPPVKPQEPTGHWIYKTMEGQFCSICGEQSVWKFNYCPNCGAKMVKLQESEDKE